MTIRKIIEINEVACNGCGECIPGCAEGAISIVNGKAKLLSDDLCDGIGNCIGHCPQDAIQIIEREAEEFSEMEVKNHLDSLKKVSKNNHVGGCPGSKPLVIENSKNTNYGVSMDSDDIEIKIKPQLQQWPVQLKLVPETAPFFSNKELLVTADCVPFAYSNYHIDLLKNKAVVIGCPKLDDVQFYINKLVNIIKLNNIKDITVAYMEVPCCQGIVLAVEEACKKSESNVNITKVKISINGQKKSE